MFNGRSSGPGEHPPLICIYIAIAITVLLLAALFFYIKDNRRTMRHKQEVWGLFIVCVLITVRLLPYAEGFIYWGTVMTWLVMFICKQLAGNDD